MNTPEEKLSLIASAFAVVDDPTADGNRASNARQTIRDVLAEVTPAEHDPSTCHPYRVVEAAVRRLGFPTVDPVATVKAIETMGRETEAAKATIAKLTADNAALRSSLREALVQAIASAHTNPGAAYESTARHIIAVMRGSGGVEGFGNSDVEVAIRAYVVDVAAQSRALVAERDAARARLAEVEAAFEKALTLWRR